MATIKFCKPAISFDNFIEPFCNNYRWLMWDILKSGQYLQGGYTKKLEDIVLAYTGRKYTLAVNSCTQALTIALLALDLPRGSEVVVSPFTFPASYTCLYLLGLKPKFCDIREDTFMMDTRLIKLTQKTKAVIAVNLFGQICDRLGVGVPVIEDAAQSFTAGTLGTEFMCLSFDPTKIVTGGGTGGMVLTDDRKLYEKAKHFHYKNYGLNSQMNEITAAIAYYEILEHSQGYEDKRVAIAKLYNEGLRSVLEVITPKETLGAGHIYHKYVIKAKRRDELKKHLMNNGIETKIHYEVNEPSCPVATEVSKQVLSLPIYPALEVEEVWKVIEEIKRFYS